MIASFPPSPSPFMPSCITLLFLTFIASKMILLQETLAVSVCLFIAKHGNTDSYTISYEEWLLVLHANHSN